MNFPIDFKKLISVERIFEITPEPIGYYLYLAIFFGLLVITAIFIKIYAKKKNKIFAKVYNAFGSLALFAGITGGLMIFMRWQSIPYIGSRFALMALVIICLLWFLNILAYIFITLPKKQKQKKLQNNFEKYLPRKK